MLSMPVRAARRFPASHVEGGPAMTLVWFLVRRFLWAVATLWVVFTVTFILMRAAPGSPFDTERKTPPEVRLLQEREFAMDKGPIGQYVHWLGHYLSGDFLISMKNSYPVNDLLAEGLPVSISLGIVSLTIAVLLGTTAGVFGAVKRGKFADFALMAWATVGITIPNFVLAGLAIIVLCFWVPVLPVAGWGGLRQLILPACCLAAPFAGYIARLTRTGMLEVLGNDYIRAAYAKGLPARTVIIRHALRGGLLPVVSYLGPAAASILTGSLVIEKLFNIPGTGVHFIQAALQRDYAILLPVTLVFTAILLALNMIVDLAYAIIDPRLKLE